MYAYIHNQNDLKEIYKTINIGGVIMNYFNFFSALFCILLFN